MGYIFTGEIRVKNPRADNAERNILHFLNFISCDSTECMNRCFPVREYIPGPQVMKITYDHVKLSSAMFSSIKYLCKLASNLYTVNGRLRYTAEDFSSEGEVSIRDNSHEPQVPAHRSGWIETDYPVADYLRIYSRS